MLGNFMADFITNKEVKLYSDKIQKGIKLHRMIDSFTDKHQAVRAGTARLRKIHGKYAPVVIDILYDNILARNWQLYDDKPLEEFTQDTYLILYRRLPDLPENLRSRVPLMVADDFLLRYRDESGLRRALRSMDRRTKFNSNFEAAADQLLLEVELFDTEFNEFFPEVMALSSKFISDEGL